MLDGEEINLAIVNNNSVSPSTPSQHAADIYELRSSLDPRHQRLFRTPTGELKPVMVFEVDGGSDENPRFDETKFLLAEFMGGGPRQIVADMLALATAHTRAANDTHLNVVERVNACETEAAASAFFSCDAIGDLHNHETGQLDPQRVEQLREETTEKYREILDGAPGLNGSVIAATRGALISSSSEDAAELLKRQPLLISFLKCKDLRKKIAELRKLDSKRIDHFTHVRRCAHHWGLNEHYGVTMSRCYNGSCRLCKDLPLVDEWYPGVPLKPFPPVYPDPDRKGHYLTGEDALMTFAAQSFKYEERPPPSIIAARIYEKVTKTKPLEPFPDGKLSEAVDQLEDSSLTREVLKEHFKHLRYVRLRVLEGHKKAQITKARKKAERAAAAAALNSSATGLHGRTASCRSPSSLEESNAPKRPSKTPHVDETTHTSEVSSLKRQRLLTEFRSPHQQSHDSSDTCNRVVEEDDAMAIEEVNVNDDDTESERDLIDSGDDTESD